MSADNCIAILRTKSQFTRVGDHTLLNNFKKRYVWRVAHVQGIDQFYYLEHNQKYNLGAYMLQTWADANICESEEEARKEAAWLEKHTTYLEYGIRTLDTEYTFYGD